MNCTAIARIRVQSAVSWMRRRRSVVHIASMNRTRASRRALLDASCSSALRGLLALLALVLLPLFAAQDAAAQGNESEYVLSPGDVVRLDILDDTKDPVDLPIAADGSIPAPLLGTVRIGGLNVAAALDELRRRYVEERIFVVPKLAFSVAVYRPIFVVGDVRLPGMYPFQLDLSVEKALGLAGGRIATEELEDPILARARLRGEMEAAEAHIIREALAYARITAELNDRAEIKEDDVPATAAEFVSGAFAEIVTDVELRIARANTEGFAAQQSVLNEQIAEAEEGLKLLNRLLENIDEIIALARGDLKRGESLQKKGLNTQSNVSVVQRQLAEQEGRQLQVLADISEARSNIGLLKSRLVELSQTRKVNALNELQEHNVQLAAHISAYRKAEEQLVLISSLTADKLAKNRQMVLDFTIRRNDKAGVVNIAADLTSSLQPGDVLVAKIRGDGGEGAVAVLPAP
jgi:protein involved in polysaccharide export with SLBB domain